MDTKFASPERVSLETLKEQSRWFNNIPYLDAILGCLPDVVFIVNEQRQIIYVNSSLNSPFQKWNVNEALGKRAGEVFNCKHAFVEVGGCGTSEFCRNCGAVNAVLNSLKGKNDEQECRISVINSHEALDLKVFTTPIEVNNKSFSVFAVSDISDEKRRRALEKIFFHDIMNTAGSLKGISELIPDATENELSEFTETLLELSEKIIEDIQTQKELSAAEQSELLVKPETVSSYDILHYLIKSLKNHVVAKGKEIQISNDAEDFPFTTDPKLLRRIMVNLVKNALEASGENGKVIINAVKKGGPEFTVWNLGYIPKPIQNQIFQRSFSTKGEGRGLGTYSIKLLTEKYLNGNVSFVSKVESGTEFCISLPNILILG